MTFLDFLKDVRIDFSTIELLEYSRTLEINGKKIKTFETAWYKKKNIAKAKDLKPYHTHEIVKIKAEKFGVMKIYLIPKEKKQ